MHSIPKAPNPPALLPARLTAEQTAAVLGFQKHDIPVLVAAGLLAPLGRRDQAANTTKYFAAVEIEERRLDAKWLSKATDVVQKRWTKRRGPGRPVSRPPADPWALPPAGSPPLPDEAEVA